MEEMPNKEVALERPATFWRVIYEHKFLIIFIILVIIGRTNYPYGPPWFIILPGILTMLIGFWESLKSRFTILRYISFAILIYACIVWVLGSGLEMSPISRR